MLVSRSVVTPDDEELIVPLMDAYSRAHKSDVGRELGEKSVRLFLRPGYR
jgi:hypothetical protein